MDDNRTFSSEIVPGGFFLLRQDFLLNLCFLVELVEVVNDDGDGE